MNDTLPLREAQAISLTVAVNRAPEPQCASPDVALERRDFRVFLEILRRQLQNSIETGEQAVLTLAGDLLEIERELSHLERDVPELLASARARIDERLADALARIQFQDTVKQQTGVVIQALRQLDGYAARFAVTAPLPESAPGGHPSAASELLRELYASYISEQQRSIHEASLKRANTSSPADSQTELP